MIRRLETPARPWTSARSAAFHAEGLSRFARAIILHFGAVDSVLDVGCGSGGLQHVLGRACGLYVGLDQMENPGVLVGDAHGLPFQDGTFDVVASKQALPHFVDPALALAEMMRVARRGVIVQQEFPPDGVGWEGHSRVHIDSPDDVLALMPAATFDGMDFVWRRP
jgi:SAM-dependent methyltransferase